MRASRRRMGLVGVAIALCAWSVAATARAEILPLSASDERRLEGQRTWVDGFVRMHTSVAPRGEMKMLEAIQRVLDLEALRPTQKEQLQSLGVALGDVMARQLGLEWVVVLDDLGRSRALQAPGDDTIYYPVTMISKRLEIGLRVDVRELYDKVAEDLRARPRPSATPKRTIRPLPPRPSEDDLPSGLRNAATGESAARGGSDGTP